MKKILKIKDIINSNSAISADQGDAVRKKIVKHIGRQGELILDFDGIAFINTPFCNNAIGALFESYSIDTISTIKFVNIDNFGIKAFRFAIDNAITHYVDIPNRQSEEIDF